MKAAMQNTSFGVLLGEEKMEASHQRREEINREPKKDGCRKAGVKSGPSRNMFSLLQCFSKFWFFQAVKEKGQLSIFRNTSKSDDSYILSPLRAIFQSCCCYIYSGWLNPESREIVQHSSTIWTKLNSVPGNFILWRQLRFITSVSKVMIWPST